MKSLPTIKDYKIYSEVIYKKIKAFYDEVLYDYIEQLEEKPLLNSNDINSDILSGSIYYENGKFISNKGFTNRQALELEKMGAVYTRGGYKLPLNKMPLKLQTSIARVNIYDQEKTDDLIRYLAEVQENAEFIANKIEFYDEVEKIGKGLDSQFKTSMATVGQVPYNLTKYQLEEIAKNYTNNLKFYIKKWTTQETAKLREGIQKLAMQGVRGQGVIKYIQQQKQVGERKARFLARQETKLFVAEYQKNRFIENGITMYKWSAVMDNRTRDSHRKLNGRIFSWKEPPIIDDATGERGNPGEAYNCYDKTTQVMTDKGFKFFWQLEENDKVLTLDYDNMKTEYQKPIRHIKQYKQRILWFKDKEFDIRVTHDHNMLVFHNGKINLIKAKECIDILKQDKFLIIIDKDLQYRYFRGSIVEEKYDDEVFCVEVEKYNTLLVKGDKSEFWCGNCRCVAIPVVPENLTKKDR